MNAPAGILLDSIVTGDEGRNFIRSQIASAPYPISVEILDTAGSPEGAIVWALGEAEAQRSADRQRFAESAFRSTASRNALAVISNEVYGLPARAADYATTTVTITNTSGGLYGPFAAGELRFVNSATDPKTIYVNVNEVTIEIGPAWTSTPIDVIALEPGSDSDAATGDINALETPLEGVTVTNPQPAFGQDEETAESINTRIDAKIGAINIAGTDSSYESIALSGIDGGGGCIRGDGSRVTVTRTAIVRDDATGTVTLYVADDDGPLAGADLTTVEGEVQAFGEWVCMTVIVSNVVAVPINVTYTIEIDRRTTATDDEVQDDIEQSLIAAFRASKIGGWSGVIPRDYIREALAAGRDGTVTWRTIKVTLTAPAGDTAIAAGQVATLGTITPTITRV